MRTDPLNRKTMYSRNRLPRLELEKTEWEKEDEIRKKKREKWQKKGGRKSNQHWMRN